MVRSDGFLVSVEGITLRSLNLLGSQVILLMLSLHWLTSVFASVNLQRIVYFLILHIRKLRLRKVKGLAQYSTVAK